MGERMIGGAMGRAVGIVDGAPFLFKGTALTPEPLRVHGDCLTRALHERVTSMGCMGMILVLLL